MLPLIINPIPLLFTLATTFGVLVHDTQLDRAATVALAVPAAIASYAAVDQMNKNDQSHTHVERVSHQSMVGLRAMVPRLQPRDDDRRYLQNKKVILGAGEHISLWPSV